VFFLSLTSCKLAGKDTYFLTTESTPKVHYSSIDHNEGAPSSFVFQNGIYSVFYQDFSLDKNKKNSIYRTTSTDLIYWEKSDKVSFSDKDLAVLYANVLIDTNKTTGLGTKVASPLVALILTEQQKKIKGFLLCYSVNHGKTWELSNSKIEFPGELMPDSKPAIIWNSLSLKWIMTLVENQSIKIYSSLDLKKWQFESTFEKDPQYRDNIWLKATLFPINKGANWVLLIDQEFPNPRDGSSIQYFIGSFDDKSFKTKITAKSQWLDYGKDNIYNVVCIGLPENAQPTVIGLKNNIDYALIGSMKPYWGSFTFPRTLHTDKYSGEGILASEPIQGIEKVKTKNQTWSNLNINETVDISNGITIPLTPSVIVLKFDTKQMTRMTFPSRFGIQFETDKAEKLVIGYDAFKGAYFVDRNNFSILKENSQFKGIDIISSFHSDSEMVLKMILDDSSVELFVENGKQALTENYFAEHKLTKVKLFAENGIIIMKELIITNLKLPS
jgi:fructan beta-fructosidase